MNSIDVPTLVAQLAPIIGAKAAAALAAAAALIVIIAHGVMPWITPASETSTPTYRRLYTLLRLIAGNYGQANPQGVSK